MRLKKEYEDFLEKDIEDGIETKQALKNLVIFMSEDNKKMGVEFNALSFITQGQGFAIIDKCFSLIQKQ